MKRVKINAEYILRASPTIIYAFLTTPECLIRWFCDELDIQDGVYTFTWDGSEEFADLVDDIEDQRVRFHWHESEDDEYLEFRMYKAGVTNETVMEITDFCDEGEEEEQVDYWNTLTDVLKKETGG